MNIRKWVTENKKIVCAFAVAAIIGLGCLLAGLVLALDNGIYDDILKAVVLLAGTIGYQRLESPDTSSLQVWVFNLTNPDDVLSDVLAAVPIVREIGPYTYSVKKITENIVSTSGGLSIRYRTRNVYTFDGEKSVGDPEKDWFVNVNLPALTIAGTAEYYGHADRNVVKDLIVNGSHKLFTKFTLDEYLWGYTDQLAEDMEDIFPGTFSDTTFGVFYQLNDSQNTFEIYSGIDNVNLVNEIRTWQGREYMDYWPNHWANMINGTDGSQYKPFVKKEDTLYTFYPDQCRTYKTSYEGDTVFRNLDAYRFIPVLNNEDFCSDQTSCLPDAFFNASSCYVLPYADLVGVPFITSYPHWYLAEERDMQKIKGLYPDKSQHETTIDIETNSGFTIQSNRRLQFNAYIRPWTVFPDTQKPAFQDGMILPILWFNEGYSVTDSEASKLYDEFIGPGKTKHDTQYALIGIGAILGDGVIILALVKYCFKKMKKKQPGRCNSTDDDDSPNGSGCLARFRNLNWVASQTSSTESAQSQSQNENAQGQRRQTSGQQARCSNSTGPLFEYLGTQMDKMTPEERKKARHGIQMALINVQNEQFRSEEES